MDTAEVLFGKYPRWVGPNQKKVYNREGFLRHVYTYSGFQDVFTSAYAFPFSDGIPLIDKLFADIDDEPEKALKKGQELFEWTTENHFTTAVNWTGNKGPHIYPLCPNIVFSNKLESADYIRKAVYFILEETGLFEYKEVTKLNGEKQEFKVPLIDSTSIGDIRRLTRVCGTRRASVFGLQLPVHCIAIEPKEFLNLSIKDIFELEREPCPFPNVKFEKENIKKHFHELDLDRVNVNEWRGQDVFNIFKNTEGSPDVPKNEIAELFKVLLPRPCVHKFIVLPNAPPPIRYAATCELHRAGMKPNGIMDLFRKINWVNWDEEETAKQVRLICSKPLDTIGKKKMQESGFCIPEDCEACRNCR
ncbi:hypothetical protein KAU33_03810 [Candidatus Dependentiae bacterium]|nr:hypothetical protein [Candidatus Dependentiae bacterium]